MAGDAGEGLMQQLTCAYCFCTDVEVVASYQRCEVTVIQCRRCGKQSPLDTENPNVDIQDPSKDAN